MLLVDHQIKRVIKELNVITPYREDLVGPNSIDVLLGSTFKRLKTDDMRFMSAYVRDPRRGDQKGMEWRTIVGTQIVLEPNEFILATTLECVKIPDNMYGIISGKSTLAREGIMVECAGFIDSGFEGNLTLEIKNLLPFKYKLHTGQLIAQICFFTCGEVENSYVALKHSYQNQQGATAARNMSKLYRHCDEVIKGEFKRNDA